MKTLLLCSFILCTLLTVDVECQPFKSGADPATRPKTGITARQSTLVSFNVANIAVLIALKGVLVLKALVLTPKGINEKFAKRSGEASQLSSKSELALETWELDLEMAKEFLHSAETGDVVCLQRFACENSERAEDYIKTGGILLSAARVMKMMGSLASLSRYEFIEQAIIEATNRAKEGEHICKSSYPCRRHH